MMPWQSPILFMALATLFGVVEAFFRINCGKMLESRIDPIVSPGKVSSHLHTLVGGSNVGYNSTYPDLRNSKCTSCEVQGDKSAYWTPQLYFQFDNGSFTMVPHDGSVVYYLGRGSLNNGSTIYTPFPPGLQMLSGDSGVRAYDNTTLTYSDSSHGGRPVSDRVSFACLATEPLAETPNITYTDCVNGLRAQIHFQTCWDGINLYKSDNSHVAYLSQIDNGICPPNYPVLFPHLFIETLYDINSLTQNYPGRLVFSMGDPTGYGFHADFMNGWDPDTQANAVANCLSLEDAPDGTIEECPVLLAQDVQNAAYECPHEDPVVQEQIYGILPSLPGCNPISPGPARAGTTCPTPVTTPSIIHTPMSTPIATKIPIVNEQYGRTNWDYVGCSVDGAQGRVLAAWSYTDTANLTVENCQTFCQSHGQKYAGVEIGTQCFCDNQITNPTWNQTECYYTCSGDDTELCGGYGLVHVFDNTAAVSPPTPSVLAKSGTYVSKGCYKEASANNAVRALPDASDATDSMTVDMCAKFCLGKNLRYFGVEYGRECYCGKNLNINSTAARMSDCNMYCSGNNNATAQYCGGPSRLNLYYSKDVISVSKRWLGGGKKWFRA